MKYGAGAGEDPSAKVKNLITDLMTRAASGEFGGNQPQGFCNEEMAKSAVKWSALRHRLRSTFPSWRLQLQGLILCMVKSRNFRRSLVHLHDSVSYWRRCVSMNEMLVPRPRKNLEQGITGLRRRWSCCDSTTVHFLCSVSAGRSCTAR